MRRLLFPALGLVELIVAVTLVVLGLSLPTQGDIHRGFSGARRVTSSAGDQVRGLREQVAALRQSRLRQAADRLQASTRAVSIVWGANRVDFDRVRVLRDALGQAAAGLDGLAGVLDPQALGRLGSGLGEVADFLDRKVLPAAARAAQDLETVSARLQATARRFGQAARETPLDLGPVRQLHDSLARFDEGLVTMAALLEPSRLAPLREASGGAEGAVAEAARFAERAAGYTYPVVELDQLRLKVRSRPFWPKGAEVGADLRKVAVGAAATRRELDALARELPKVQAAVAESRKALGATRQALALALAHQGEVERLLKEMPERAARLADELPRLTGDLSKALRDTGNLNELAADLRQAQRGIDAAVERWPKLTQGLAASATLLKETRDELDGVLRHRREYEAALEQVGRLSDEFAAALPTFTGRLDDQLDGEDRTLAEMERGIGQVDAVLPHYERSLSRCLTIGGLLTWLVAAIAAIHGSSLIVSVRRWRRG